MIGIPNMLKKHMCTCLNNYARLFIHLLTLMLNYFLTQAMTTVICLFVRVAAAILISLCLCMCAYVSLVCFIIFLFTLTSGTLFAHV